MREIDKGLALARLGWKVFPCDPDTRAPMIPGIGGLYHATDDFETIATWWSVDYPDAVVGVWTGGSGLLTLDLDRGKASGKDGFKALNAVGLVKPSNTWAYPTPSGGEHVIWRTDRVDLSPQSDATVDGKKLLGVDVRAGGSYMIWWGDQVPTSLEEISTDIPAWVIEAATAEAVFTGEGFSGSVDEWLQHVSQEILPSSRVANFINNIPQDQFGHPEMVNLVWGLVRMGSERETGIRLALEKLQAAWLRKPFDTRKNRSDFNKALMGAITKGGRVQNPMPSIGGFAASLKAADARGAGDILRGIEGKVSETDSEVDFARARKEMFSIVREAGLSATSALGVVMGSKAFKFSKVSAEGAWFNDGEPFFHEEHEYVDPEIQTEPEPEPTVAEIDEEEIKRVASMSADAAAFSFLSDEETELLTTHAYRWWGDEYLEWVQGRLKHFNRPYHVASMWASLSVITSPWGKVPLAGAKPTDCNLYLTTNGASSTGKTEASEFGTSMTDAYYGTEASPIIGDISKLSALALHRALILRDGEPSMVYGDEVQSFFQGIQGSQWQNGILGDISSHYGGNVSPKLTLNDKEISGKRARTMLTTYLTGIADQLLEAISLQHWTSGFFYRYLWGFGNPRIIGDNEIKMELTSKVYTSQFEDWAREFKRIAAVQAVKWGVGRLVQWDDDALKRMEQLKADLDATTLLQPLHDSVFVNANGRFLVSILKVATIVAMLDASEKVTLRHALIAISYAGPWHRSMVLAVQETAKDPFDREVEKCLTWIERNSITKIGSPSFIQRSAVMRAFRPMEIAERMLRQLTEERRLTRSGDNYEIVKE